MSTKAAQAHKSPAIFIGCAGWSIPSIHLDRFGDGSSHLQRYARVFNAAEINSSFYRPHRTTTYARWAATVPAEFRFAVKMPRTLSHQARLQGCDELLRQFLGEVEALGRNLGCLLLQLPPGLAYDAGVALPFFDGFRRLYGGAVVCEPRHASWFHPAVSAALAERGIARVAADPALMAQARAPAGDRAIQYLRLHGSPRIYHDSYPEATLRHIACRLQRTSRRIRQRWCIFDNTASGHAIPNALDVMERIAATRQHA